MEVFFGFLSQKSGWEILLQCNFDSRTLSITLPAFYRECLQAWSSITKHDSSSYEGMNRTIWNNKYILRKGEINRLVTWFLRRVFFSKVTKF